jgi:hypothetical protein
MLVDHQINANCRTLPQYSLILGYGDLLSDNLEILVTSLIITLFFVPGIRRSGPWPELIYYTC